MSKRHNFSTKAQSSTGQTQTIPARRHKFSNISGNTQHEEPFRSAFNTVNTNMLNHPDSIQYNHTRGQLDQSKSTPNQAIITETKNQHQELQKNKSGGYRQINDPESPFNPTPHQLKRNDGKVVEKTGSIQAFSGVKNIVKPVKKQEKCVICGTITQKCCGLCRKTFYCSGQHQQVDWHSRHKNECPGNNPPLTEAKTEEKRESSPNKFVFYSNNKGQKISEAYEKELEYQNIHLFLESLEQRLINRQKIMGQVAKINERTPLIVRQSLVRQGKDLMGLSQRITYQQFRPSFSKKITKKDILQYSSNHWGNQILVTEDAIALEYYADLVLMAKLHHLCGFEKEARDSIIGIGRILQETEQKKLFLNLTSTVHKRPIYQSNNFTQIQHNATEEGGIGSQNLIRQPDLLHSTKNLVLEAILQLSEGYNIDKTSQSVYKLFVKKIQLEEGVWEQIYAYFNMGVWYKQKTYFQKSVKSFQYSLQLLESHKKGTIQAGLFKGDCLYNISQCFWALGQRQTALQNAQDSYRNRVNSIGKNSLECSNSLYLLGKWHKQLQKWSQCIQYIEECLRIRFLYESESQKVEQIKQLIVQVHSIIKKEKKNKQDGLQPVGQKYYSQILQKDEEQRRKTEAKKIEQKDLLPKGTVASRLFREQKQYCKIKLDIPLQLWQNFTSQQVKLLTDLILSSDKVMQKQHAINFLNQSQFVQSLNPKQREQFYNGQKLEKVIIPSH